jgi:hypothetical protein
MNEEEKQAIEILRSFEPIDLFEGAIYLQALEKLTNLIDKLQKENEELKEYIATAPNLDEMTATKYRNIQQDAYIQGRAEEQQKAEQIIYENYIPKQTVKDKIEELKKNLYTVEHYETVGAINVLQELLEGRK